MPLYDYAPASGQCSQCNGRFEVMQRIAEPALTHCPGCRQPCVRLISAVALGGKYSVSDAKVKSLGLTKFRKSEDGVYERTTGDFGPEVLHRK